MTWCFDIGGSFIKYGVPAESGLVPELGRVKTPGADFDAFAGALKKAIAEMPQSATGIVSLSMAGIADAGEGRAKVANVPCLNGRRLETELAAKLGHPVRITNDADAFALAEARLGAGKGSGVVFAIILGTGVGGGLVIDGQLVHGFGGVSGEWGHGPMIDPGAGGLIEPIERFACGCGQKGCLDTVGGARGLERLHAAIHNQALDSGAILERWQAGEAAAGKTVAVFVEHLARGLSVITNTIGAASIPVGGGLSAAPELIAAIDTRTREMVLARYEQVLVVPGERRADGGLVGAALAAQLTGVLAA